MISDVEQFFTYVLAICVSLFEKHLFVSFAHFLIVLFVFFLADLFEFICRFLDMNPLSDA